ncbi:MAG: hypothetical protein C4330_09865 [Chitinophagaceae bacterium]
MFNCKKCTGNNDYIRSKINCIKKLSLIILIAAITITSKAQDSTAQQFEKLISSTTYGKMQGPVNIMMFLVLKCIQKPMDKTSHF